MTPADFKNTTDIQSFSPLLQSLWHDAHGDWHKAHNIAQDIETPAGAWVHAYLHRKEGDIWNADYWYRRAGKTRPEGTLEEEWEQLVRAFL
jgi:hypothetical protein